MKEVIMTNKIVSALVAAVKQHHNRVSEHLATCEDDEEGYRKHGMFLMTMQEHEAALKALCEEHGQDFYSLAE